MSKTETKKKIKDIRLSEIPKNKRYPLKLLEHAKKVTFEGTDEERLAFFAIYNDTPLHHIHFKFDWWARVMFPRYYTSAAPDFHHLIIDNMVDSYYGRTNYVNLGFRGCAKTTLTKLFIAFIILNDRDEFRKYMKVLTRNQGNARQIVTDVYNLMVEVQPLYGDYFLKDTEKKREETMGSFTTSDGRKLLSGTIGMTQRGHLQDASRPDWIVFDDVEDRESITSLVQTESTIFRIQEAIDGMSADGRYMVNGNYISEEGVIQWFINKPSTVVDKIPIMDEDGNPAWPARYPAEKIEEIRKDAEDFYGEYMCDPTRADATFFDRIRVDAAIENAEQPHRESAGVRYYGDYQPHHAYAIGADIGEGVGRDSSTMVGWDFGQLNGGVSKVCLAYNDNTLAPDLFGHEMMRVGAEFGNCLLAPERNNAGHGTIVAMKGYPNIYSQVDESKYGVKVTDKLGWLTNKKTKPQMFFEFRKDWNDGLIEITDLALLKEMRAYTTMDLQDTRIGLATRHFDLLTAAVIGYQMKKYVHIGYDDADFEYEEEPLYPSIGI